MIQPESKTDEKKRKLSLPRLAIAIIILIAGSFGIYDHLTQFVTNRETYRNFSPWFAPYVDVTSTPQYAFEQPGNHQGMHNLILSFIVSLPSDACTPSWGGSYTLNDANAKLDLDRRIARFRQQGGTVAISFGGLLNDELSVTCTDENKLSLAYKQIIDRYSIDTLDLDIEGQKSLSKEVMNRRAKVLAKLQKEYRTNGKKLAIWLTLPVAPQGLTPEGTDAVTIALENGIDLSGVNVMTMDYGNSKNKNLTMRQSSEAALTETHRQLGILFKVAGINLNSQSIWAKIGLTPMIGQNDSSDEVFDLNDAKGLNEFAIQNRIARVSMWSLNRDIQCGENYVNTTVVSDSCSGIKQNKLAFSNLLSNGFDGDITSSASITTSADPEATQETDDPKKSPYQIWDEKGTYLEGDKVVWHHNVYQAKWWTSGDFPDNPVLQTYQTPWQLIGPVLSGETPIPQPTVPPGTYPAWSGEEIYDAGRRVLFNGVAYQAKWWTQGDSPAAATSNPDSSPWIVVTNEQILEILKTKNNSH